MGLYPFLLPVFCFPMLDAPLLNWWMISEFETMDDLEKYKNNHEHLKVSALCKQIRIDRQAIDYEF